MVKDWMRPFCLAALLAPALPALAAELLPEAPTLSACQGEELARAPDRTRMERELQDYLQLSEQALSMRAGAIQLYQELQDKKNRGTALNGQDLLRINQGAAALLAQRNELLERALAHECWPLVPPPADREAADLRRTGVLISLSAALTLYDNYLSAISLYRNDPALRQHLNRADQGFAIPARELQRIDQMFASPDNRRRVRRAISWYQEHARTANPPLQGYDYLVQSIEQSPSYRMVQRSNPLANLGRGFEIFGTFTVDTLIGLKEEGTHLSSLLFGNTVGLVETRRGKLDRRPDVQQRLLGELRAGDILLEKTPFRLTDTFIPGHWGHAAIWIGTEAELRDMGLWDHPLVRPHHKAIRSGRGVVEALRTGVEMNTLAHFLNVDDVAVLRQPGLPDEKRLEIILQTLRQVGKAYDFNFDAESTHRVFCSKLVYLAYGDMQWPTTRFLGRFTISPDNIAQRATDKGPLSVALLYHDGQEVRSNPQRTMTQLLEGQNLHLARQEQAGMAP